MNGGETPLYCVASVVLYRDPPERIENLISDLFDTRLKVKLCIVDNSPAPVPITPGDRPILYHHAGRNLGYGKANNWSITNGGPSRYFLILNPDVSLSGGVLEALAQYMDGHPEVGAVCPKILNGDGTLQPLNKRRPTVLDLFLRRFCAGSALPCVRKRLDRYEMRDVGYDDIHEVPFMTGAFMFCRTRVLREVGGFDPRYFMYFEDADLSRKIQNAGFKTVYYPHVQITHLWKRESRKRLAMALVFLISGMKYFRKWGWKWL